MQIRWSRPHFLAPFLLYACAAAPGTELVGPPSPAVPPAAEPDPEPDPSAYPVWGIDISHHQGLIDWPKVASEPRMRFAYLKATQGSTHVDDRFAHNWEAARAAGLMVGAYHYFSFCTGPQDQVANFLAVLPKGVDMMPPALDVEHLMNCAPDPDPEKVRADLRLWLSAVEAATGRKPVVYATSDVLADYFLGAIDVPLWVRHTPEDPEAVLDLPWTLWQYDDQHSVGGITTTVDHDVFSGTPEALAALVRGDP